MQLHKAACARMPAQTTTAAPNSHSYVCTWSSAPLSTACMTCTADKCQQHNEQCSRHLNLASHSLTQVTAICLSGAVACPVNACYAVYTQCIPLLRLHAGPIGRMRPGVALVQWMCMVACTHPQVCLPALQQLHHLVHHPRPFAQLLCSVLHIRGTCLNSSHRIPDIRASQGFGLSLCQAARPSSASSSSLAYCTSSGHDASAAAVPPLYAAIRASAIQAQERPSMSSTTTTTACA